MNDYTVTATMLRLRSSPVITPDNIVTTLTQGQRVSLVDNALAAWWRVRTQLGHDALEGFVASQHLQSAAAIPQPTTHSTVDRVDFPPSPGATRASIEQRHCPLGEANMPRRDPAGAAAQRIADLQRIADFLDVEHSARYQPTTRSTYCNIYAYDFCTLAAVYLPRVWWTAKALVALSARQAVAVQYDTTVAEVTANALSDWLEQWGTDFGWQRIFDLTALQQRANDGRVGVISARRKDLSRSGHITVVVPEHDGSVALRSGPAVVAPLQSQAGARNKKYFSNAWFVALSQEFSRVNFWSHD